MCILYTAVDASAAGRTGLDDVPGEVVAPS